MIDCGTRARELLEQIVLTDDDVCLGVVDDVRQLPRPQHRHRCHADRADSLHRQPRGDEERAIQKPHHHAITRLHSEMTERVADPIHLLLQLAVGDAAVAGDDRGVRSASIGDVDVDERRRQILRRGIREVGFVSDDRGPQLARRQVMHPVSRHALE